MTAGFGSCNTRVDPEHLAASFPALDNPGKEMSGDPLCFVGYADFESVPK